MQDISYVRSDGDNGNAGTLAAPFETLDHAADVTNPGGKIYVVGAGNIVNFDDLDIVGIDVEGIGRGPDSAEIEWDSETQVHINIAHSLFRGIKITVSGDNIGTWDDVLFEDCFINIEAIGSSGGGLVITNCEKRNCQYVVAVGALPYLTATWVDTRDLGAAQLASINAECDTAVAPITTAISTFEAATKRNLKKIKGKQDGNPGEIK